MLLPDCIDDYVPEDAPVRAYDAMIDTMDLSKLGFVWNPKKVGNPQYHPKAMLKLMVYGYSYGVRSSRKLERECNYNLSFIWLLGGMKPDHKTIAEFRRRNKKALKNVLRSCARMCLRIGLIEGNTLFVDGSKFRANAGIANSWTPKKCKEALERIESRIETILSECEAVDEEEAGADSLVKLRKKLADKENLKERIESIYRELKEEEKASTNRTDGDCVRVKGRQGSHAGYNSQIAVDEKHGLIVTCEVVNQNNDLGQLESTVEQANETLETPCQTVCADAGYANYDDIQAVEDQEMEVIVPSNKQAHSQSVEPFDKLNFEYDAERDVYRCPAGECLSFRRTRKGCIREYQPKKGTCSRCRHFGVCTNSKEAGRQITRYVNEDYRKQVAKRYESVEGQAVYKKRKEKVELPFGHIKRNLGAGHFLLRGLEGVRAEMSLLSTCFNMVRMINLLGIKKLICQMNEIRV